MFGAGRAGRRLSIAGPLWIVLALVSSILGAETLVMATLRRLGVSLVTAEVIDAPILVILLLPILYALVFRPLVRGIAARDQAIEEMQLALTVFERASEGIMITDAGGVIQSVNPSFTRITGYSAAEVIGQTPRVLRSGRHDEAFYRRMWGELLAHGHWAGEIWNRRKDGGVYPENLSITAVREASGEAGRFVAILSQAFHDRLTGLSNRHFLVEELKHTLALARRQGAKVGVLFLDLDGFKQVNDVLGHEMGDLVLRETAAHLRATLRESDLAGRWGGDEFVVVVANLERDTDAELVARKLVDGLHPPCLDAHPGLRVSASVGIAMFPEHGDDPAELVRAADAAMYDAKLAGKRTVRSAAARPRDEAAVT